MCLAAVPAVAQGLIVYNYEGYWGKTGSDDG
jgi:hypothetical protein